MPKTMPGVAIWAQECGQKIPGQNILLVLAPCTHVSHTCSQTALCRAYTSTMQGSRGWTFE